MSRNIFQRLFILLIFLNSLFSLCATDDALANKLLIAQKYKYINLDSAIYFCEKIQSQVLLSSDPADEITILSLQSDIYRKKGDYESAMSFAKTAKKKAIQKDLKEVYAYALLSEGSIYLELLAFDLAYANYMEALQIFLHLKNKEGEAWAYNNLGVLMSMQGDESEGFVNFTQAQKAVSTLENDVLKAITLNNLGLSYYKRSDFIRSVECLTQSLKICQREGLHVITIYNYANLALIESQNKNQDKAIDYWTQIESVARIAKTKYQLARAIYSKAWLFYKIGNKEEALRYFSESFEISQKIGSVEMIKKNLPFLSELYHDRGDIEKAYQYAWEYNLYTDSINRIQNQHNIMKLRYEYDYQKEKEDNLWMNRIRNIIIIVLLLIVSLLAFAGIVVFKRNRLKIRNINLEREKLELDLDHQNKKVTTKLIYLQKKNELISLIADKLQNLRPKMKIQNQNAADEIIKILKANSDTDNWKEFELRFEEVNGDFLKKLNREYPDLSPNEKRLCAYLKLNMSTKEIASLLYLSVHSVDSARYRLRKKLNLTNSDIELSTFFEQF